MSRSCGKLGEEGRVRRLSVKLIPDRNTVLMQRETGELAREDLYGVSNVVGNLAPNDATPFDDRLHVDVVS